MVRYQYVGYMYPLHGARGISRCAARVTIVPPAPRLQLNALYRVESRSRAPPARCRQLQPPRETESLMRGAVRRDDN
jgi:hypothetical protein